MPATAISLSQPLPTPIIPASLPTKIPTPTIVTITTTVEAVAATPIADTGWQRLQPGLEKRLINIFDGQGQHIDSLYLLRIKPDTFRFSVEYHPGQPQSLAEWQAETGALIVVNGGFFTPEFIATGLMVVDGHTSGTSYQDFGGMLAITDMGPELRWLENRPYDPNESLNDALQSFPILVKPPGLIGQMKEDGMPARRTVIAQDTKGRILFIISPWGSFSLHQLGDYLVSSDLEIDIALNLDGGASTGILLMEPEEGIPAFANVPAVIAVHSR